MSHGVFISHASEDKERFVLRLAERLGQKGIDVWFDEWEILPGDNLVDKIFNAGLKQSDVVIVVLSNVSVEKPWVQKELSSAVVKNIEDNTRLIPVMLDGCTVPECLRELARINVRDPYDCTDEIERIVSAIYGQYERPAVKFPPAYTQLEVLRIDDLCRSDAIFLEDACRVALENGHPYIADPELFERRLLEKGMPLQDILDAQDVLAKHYYIRFDRSIGPRCLEPFDIETAGFSAFAEAGGVPDYNRRMTEIARFLVERIGYGVVENTSIERELKLPPMLVEHILERLSDIGYIEYGKGYGGRLYMYVDKVSPELRRKLEFIDQACSGAGESAH